MVRVLRQGYFWWTKWFYKLVHCTTIYPCVGKWLWVTAIFCKWSWHDSLPERNVMTSRPTNTHHKRKSVITLGSMVKRLIRGIKYCNCCLLRSASKKKREIVVNYFWCWLMVQLSSSIDYVSIFIYFKISTCFYWLSQVYSCRELLLKVFAITPC